MRLLYPQIERPGPEWYTLSLPSLTELVSHLTSDPFNQSTSQHDLSKIGIKNVIGWWSNGDRLTPNVCMNLCWWRVLGVNVWMWAGACIYVWWVHNSIVISVFLVWLLCVNVYTVYTCICISACVCVCVCLTDDTCTAEEEFSKVRDKSTEITQLPKPITAEPCNTGPTQWA